MSILEIWHPNKQLEGSIELPNSKSHLNRLLILKKLYAPNLILPYRLDSNDAQILSNIIESVEGATGKIEVDAEDSGTAFRFSMAYLCLLGGHYILKGTRRLLERPNSELVSSLQDIGFNIFRQSENSSSPVEIISQGVEYITNRSWEIDISRSSQFASALLLIAPSVGEPVQIKLTGKPVSFGYIVLTMKTMQNLGLKVSLVDDSLYVEPATSNISTHVAVEKDWSSASYFVALSCLSNSARILLKGLKLKSIQPDIAILDLADTYNIHYMQTEDGVLFISEGIPSTQKNVERDYTSFPDIALTEIVAHTALDTPLRFTGVAHLAFKESDRIKNITAHLERFKDLSKSQPICFNTFDDHRIAMSLSMLSMLRPIQIVQPEVVNKSFPDFWNQLEKLNFQIKKISAGNG
jgi:3-phosphoshikimate 1-carboxyvinyltransferase